MIIRKITGNKKEYLDLLLLADEQESMLDKYLDRGEMFVLDEDSVKAECVITKEEGEGVYELKNIAVRPDCQRRGYGKRLINALLDIYPDCKTLYVGTGDCISSLSFYHACGFRDSHRVKNFFTDNYDHAMFEDGVQLIDMVYLKRTREGKSPLFECVDCVSLYVDDLNEGIRFYRDGLSLNLLWKTENSCGLGLKNDITEVVLVNQHNPTVNFKVESVAEALPRFTAAGGRVEIPPFDIDIGKCAVVSDAWGNRYCLLDMTKGKYTTDKDGNVSGVKREDE